MAPKELNAVIAAHEAGKHDVYNGGYPTEGPQPGKCRLCAKAAKVAEQTASAPIPAPEAPVVIAPRKVGRAKPLTRVATPRPRDPGEGTYTTPAKAAAKKARKARVNVLPPAPVAPAPEVPARKSRKAPEVPVFVPETLVDRYAPTLVPAGPSREAWLEAAVEHLRIDFTEAGFPVPEKVRVSVGWPGGRGKKAGVIGQCWPQSMATDSLHAIFISPVLTDPIRVLGVLVHELVHASVEKGTQHKGSFVKAAKHIGLTPKWTATGESPELVERLTIIAGILGDYNHGGLTNLGRQAVQTTRMLKVECPECGCILRMTEKWLTEAGVPTCGCGTEMVRAGGSE